MHLEDGGYKFSEAESQNKYSDHVAGLFVGSRKHASAYLSSPNRRKA